MPCLRSNKSGYTMNGHMDNSDMRVPIANTMVEPSMVSTLKESKASLLPEVRTVIHPRWLQIHAIEVVSR